MRPRGGCFNGLAGMGHFSGLHVNNGLEGFDISMYSVVCRVSMYWVVLIFQCTGWF